MSGDQVHVKVLYDYTYGDEPDENVTIKRGEVYRLLQKTNDEWWHVCDKNQTGPLEESDGIFVPAQYVQELNDAESAISDLDGVLGLEEDQRDYGNSTASGTDAKCAPSQQEQGVLSTSACSGMSPDKHSVNGMGKTAYDDEVDYVNLDQYRQVSNIPALSQQDALADTESDYANLSFHLENQHIHSDHGPQLQDGTFVRVLLDGLPWDIYEDRATKRKFFHNRSTGELTWKPPRKEKPSSPTGKSQQSIGQDHPLSKTQEPTSPKPLFRLDSLPEQTAEDFYDKTEDGGNVFYVNKSTKEKWQQLVDEAGRQYYHRIGSNDTQWELPIPPSARSKSVSQESSPRNGETMRDGAGATSNTATMSLTRHSKSKSMYGKIEMSQPDMDIQKAGTLPPNFAPGGGDQLTGYLNKTKIAESGKRKVRKNWSTVYVVLNQSNLVFYKDQKAAEKKVGSPYGKPEGVISLQGARVDFNPPKDVTGSSRRNTILLSVSSGSQFLLHCDDEKKIHEWLVRLKIVANDLSEKQESTQRDHDSKDTASSGKSVAASVGVGRSLSTTSDEGNTSSNWTGIRARLLNFITRRPTQEDLVKRGIIKDAVFGASLQDLCDRDKSPVPNFVLECITAVENKGLEHDGLYRVSGNMAEIQRLRYVVDKDEHHDLLDDQWDVHTLTGALKLFFRELREPLFPLKIVDKFTDAIKKESRKDKLKGFKEALSALPKCNYETMRVLFQHLRNLIQHSRENRMQTQNVAIVFGPTLMWADGDFANMAINTVYQSKVVEFLLLEYENLFR